MKLEDLNPSNHPTTNIITTNLMRLSAVLSDIESLYGKPFIVTSGLRNTEDQNRINPGAKNSPHLSGEAADVVDVDGSIYQWFMDNIDYVIRAGIYIESRTYTPRWTHIQIRPTKSGNRFFIP